LWRSVLLVEETGGTGESHRPITSHQWCPATSDSTHRLHINFVCAAIRVETLYILIEEPFW
jgi:hypothetical protein